MRNVSPLVGAMLAVAFLAACDGGASAVGSSPSSLGASGVMPSSNGARPAAYAKHVKQGNTIECPTVKTPGGQTYTGAHRPTIPRRVGCQRHGSIGPQLLYVTNGGNSTITAYDEQGNQQTLSGSFAGVYYPVGLLFDPNNHLLYVGMCNNGNYINAYDTSGNLQTLQPGAFPNLGDPNGIAYDPSNGLLYVTNYQYAGGNYGGITVYDETGNEQTLSGSFFGAYQTTNIAYDPNNGFLYNTNYGCCGQALVTVYDRYGTLQLLSGSFPGLTAPTGIIYNPSNGFIYVSEGNQQHILAYDENGNPRALSGSWTGLDFPMGMAYDPYNGLIYVANSGGGEHPSSITAYDNEGNQQTLSGSFTGLSYSDTVIVVPASYGPRARKHHGASNQHTMATPAVSHQAVSSFR